MEKRSTISKKTLKIILGICIGVTILAVAGLFVYTYLADHNTLGRKISIWGVDVSGLDAKQAEEKITAEFADRPVSFQENDQEVYSTTLKELGYSLNEEALLSKLTEIQKQREESRKLFPKEENIEPECQIEEDEEQEKQALDLSNFGTEERKASVDAAIQYDKEKKEFTLVKQVQGTEIDPDKLETTVDTNLNVAFDTALLGDIITVPINKHVYVSPTVTVTEDMKNKVTDLNSQLKKYRSSTVTYTFGSETAVLDSDTITSWLKAEGETLTLDEEAIKALALSQFDIVIVAIGDNIQANLMTSMLLKEMKMPHVVSKAENALQGKMLKKMGVDMVIYPEYDVAQRLAQSLTREHVMDYLQLSKSISLIEVDMPKFLVGTCLKDSNLREKYNLNAVGIRRGEDLEVPPNPFTILSAEDKLLIIGNNSDLDALTV